MATLSVSRAWEETKAVLRRDGRLFAIVALALFVLPGVVAELVTPSTEPGELPPFGLWTVLSILALLISLVGQLAVCRLALGPQVSVGEAIRHGARRAPAYVASALLWVLPALILFALLASQGGSDPKEMPPAIAVGLLLVMLAFLALAVRLILASPVATAEQRSPAGILSRSWELTRGRWLKLFAVLVLFVLALLILITAVSAVIGSLVVAVVGDIEPLSVSALLLSLATQIVGAVITVLLMVMLSRIYAQLSGAAEPEATVPHAP